MKTAADTLEQRVHEALADVPDPEIPACSIVDLGMVERVEVRDDSVEVDLLPTWIGCPAKDIIGEDAERAIRTAVPDREVRVRFVHSPAWSTERITDEGQAALRGYGIAPHWQGGPPVGPVVVPLMRKDRVRCPYCGSAETAMESAFGPTPCRTQHFCSGCRNPFEGFKQKT